MLLHKRCSPTAGCIACIIEDIVNREFPSQIVLPFNSLKKDASDLNHFAGVVVLLSAVLCFWGSLYKPRVLHCTRAITNTILAVSCLDVLFQPTKDSLTFCIFLDRAFSSTVLQQKLATLL